MTFIQIIEYTTDRFDEMQALGEQMRQTYAADAKFTALTMTKDRDAQNRYVTIVEFPSYEEAMANSSAPETQEFAAQMQQLSTSAPRFLNLDVVRRYP
jgi:hypothetical protein